MYNSWVYHIKKRPRTGWKLETNKIIYILNIKKYCNSNSSKSRVFRILAVQFKNFWCALLKKRKNVKKLSFPKQNYYSIQTFSSRDLKEQLGKISASYCTSNVIIQTSEFDSTFQLLSLSDSINVLNFDQLQRTIKSPKHAPSIRQEEEGGGPDSCCCCSNNMLRQKVDSGGHGSLLGHAWGRGPRVNSVFEEGWPTLRRRYGIGRVHSAVV